jgi:hypothetical protein
MPDMRFAKPFRLDGPTPATHNGCEACGGRGYIFGEDLGVVGMVGDDGKPIRIPCICCEQDACQDARREPPALSDG